MDPAKMYYASLGLMVALTAAPFTSRNEAAAVVAAGDEQANEAIDQLVDAGRPGLWALNAMLAKSRGDKKARVLEAIGKFRTSEAEYVLRREVKTSRRVVRIGAIKGLGHLKSARVARVLIDNLSHHREDVQNAALAALFEIGPSVRNRIRPLVTDGDPRLRMHALSFLFEYGIEKEVVVQALDDPSTRVVRHALSRIASKRDRRFARVVRRLAEAAGPNAADAAGAYALVAPARDFERIVSMIADARHGDVLWRRVATTLAEHPNRRGYAMLAAAALRCPKERRRQIEEMMTGDLDTERSALLVGLLTARRPGVSALAGAMLAGAGEHIEDGAFAALPDAGLRARRTIAKLLVDAPRARVERKMRAALAQYEFGPRISALFVLENMADPLHIPMILEQSRHERPDVRMAAIAALKEHDNPPAVDAMMAALLDENPDVRHAALEALAHKRSKLRTEAIVAMLEAERQSTRLHAIRLLSPPRSARIQARLLDRLEMASPAERRAIINGIARADLPNRDLLLINLVTHRNHQVRVAAAAVIDQHHAGAGL